MTEEELEVETTKNQKVASDPVSDALVAVEIEKESEIQDGAAHSGLARVSLDPDDVGYKNTQDRKSPLPLSDKSLT